MLFGMQTTSRLPNSSRNRRSSQPEIVILKFGARRTALNPILWHPRKGFIALNEVNFSSLFWRKSADPFRRLPPSGDQDVGVRNVVGSDRTGRGIKLCSWYAEESK